MLSQLLVFFPLAFGHSFAFAENKTCVPEIAGAADGVGLIGISDREMVELRERGVISAAGARLWPRLTDGSADLTAFLMKNDRFESDGDDEAAQLKRAQLDAWARSVADLLNARHGVSQFTTEAYLGFIRDLASDRVNSEFYSPSASKLRRASERSTINKTGHVQFGRLRTLAKVVDVAWPRALEPPEVFTRAIEAKFAGLPAAAGVVLRLKPSALTKITWSDRAAPHLKRIEVDDVVSDAKRLR